MTFHGTNLIHNPRKRTTNNNYTDSIIMNLNATPIAIHASTTHIHPSYRSSSVDSIISITPKKDYIFQSQTSSINLKPVHIAFSETKKRKETQQKYDVIDIAHLQTTATNLNIKDIENISSHSHNHNHRHYRNNPNNDNEILDCLKWSLFCLAALSAAIVFISYLLQTTGDVNYFNNNKKFLPHHMDSHYGYHQIEGSIANAYMRPRKSLHINHKSHTPHPAANARAQTQTHVHVQANKDLKYHLVRNDKYSILDDILFLVFKSSLNGNDSDGRDIILESWGTKYKDLYDINIKFVNTANNRFIGEYVDVIDAPFGGESAMCLLWAIDEYADGYKWVFKVDDITFVMIENLVDYLNEIELEQRLLAHDYYWWLGNRLQTDGNDANSIFTSGGAGFLLNRAILDLLVDDMRNNSNIYNINKYMMCKQEGIKRGDLCIAYLLKSKYKIYSTVTLDMDENEKFNVWDPMTLFGFGGIYKLPIDWYTKYKRNIGQIAQKEGINYISKTPITFHYVTVEWMEAYYGLFYLHKNAKDIPIITEKIGAKQINSLNEYAQIVTQYSLTNHIKNIEHEMQHVTTDLNYNMVK